MTILQNDTLLVQRRWLYLLAGLLWGAVGVMLCVRAWNWLTPEALSKAVPLELVGIVAGVLIYRFMFSKIADKNIKRIRRLRERESILAFQAARSYLLIAFMMSLGIALRHSAIPKPYLAVMYTGIGLGLLLASLRYYRHITG